MPHPLTDRSTVDEPPLAFLTRVGEVFATFDRQDSGNVSFGVRVGRDRFFVKTPGDPDDTAPYFDLAGRVALLRNAATLAGRVTALGRFPSGNRPGAVRLSGSALANRDCCSPGALSRALTTALPLPHWACRSRRGREATPRLNAVSSGLAACLADSPGGLFG